MRTGRLGVSVVLALTLVATSAAQSKFTLKVHTGRGQVGYDVNSTMIIGERDMLLIDPQFSLSEAHKLAAEILETKKRLVDDLLDARAPGSSVRAGGAEAGVPGGEDRRAAGDRQRREDRLAGAPEVLGRRLRQQYSRARAGAAGGTGDAGAHARGRGVPDHRRRSGSRRSRQQLRLGAVAEGGHHRRHRLRSRLLRRAARRRRARTG